VAEGMARLGDREGLARALAAAEGIERDWARALALAAVAEGMARVAGPGEAEAVAWVHAAFRAARARGRDEVWRHIRAFAPLLDQLGVLPATWERIRAVGWVLPAVGTRMGRIRGGGTAARSRRPPGLSAGLPNT